LAPPPKLGEISLVLVAARNPLNIGAAARAMSNFGCRNLRVVNPYHEAFREARSAVGAAHVLSAAKEYDSVSEAVADCSLIVGTTAVGQRQLHHSLRPLQDGARLILRETQRKRAGHVALLFGSEKTGLSNDDFSHCHWLLHIPTSDDNYSMNLGQAVAVCLYELTRAAGFGRQRIKNAAPARQMEAPAAAVDVERISVLLLDAMLASGYLKRKPTADAQARLRRLVRRMKLSAGDVPAWLSILRQIVWKCQRPDSGSDSAIGRRARRAET
jgi:TrmH family RNA methyltransferase